MMLMVTAAILLSLYYGKTKGGIFNTMADYNAYLVPGVIVAYVAGILQPSATASGALASIVAGPLLSIALVQGAARLWDHNLQAFHRAGLATVGCYLVLLVVSGITRHERSDAREQYTWGRYRAGALDGDAPPRPWWQNDRLWACLLVLCTLAMCWYFA
jgi:hypothetical protein